MADPAQLQGPLLVTVAYFLLWYGFLFGLQSRTKYRLKARYEAQGESFDRYHGQDPEMVAADRVVTNTHEQMGPFLASLWLFAVFSSPLWATVLGASYVGLRAAYPSLMGKRVSKFQGRRVVFVTFPCYLIVFGMFGGAVWAAFAG